MGYTMAIEVGAQQARAVVLHSTGDAVELELGDVDDLAADVLDKASSESMRALVAHSLGRATVAQGHAPDAVAVVRRGVWPDEGRDELLEAMRLGGATKAHLLDESATESTPPGLVGSDLGLAGSAAAVAAGFGRIVTREDLEPDRSVSTPASTPVVTTEPEGSASVFDTDPSDAPAVPVTAPPPASAPAPPPGGLPPVATRHPAEVSVPDRRLSTPMLAGLVALAVVVAAVLAVWAIGSGSQETTTDTTPSTTAPAESSTTAPSTTSTTTTSTTTSTTTTTTSTTTTTTTVSTTTVPVRLGPPGPVTLGDSGLGLDTAAVVRFGQDGDVVIDELAAVLGDPDDDTGMIETAVCAGTRTRFVRWDDLEIVIDEDEEGAATFSQWYADGSRRPTGLVTVDGVGVGATVGLLEVNYGSALQLVPALDESDIGLFAVTNSGSGGTILGLTTGFTPEDTITEIWAGDSCPRVFT